MWMYRWVYPSDSWRANHDFLNGAATACDYSAEARRSTVSDTDGAVLPSFPFLSITAQFTLITVFSAGLCNPAFHTVPGPKIAIVPPIQKGNY